MSTLINDVSTGSDGYIKKTLVVLAYFFIQITLVVYLGDKLASFVGWRFLVGLFVRELTRQIGFKVNIFFSICMNNTAINLVPNRRKLGSQSTIQF